MELFWMIAVTLAALGFAWYIGGILDTRALHRQKAEKERAAQEWLQELARAAMGGAQALCRKGFLEREKLTAAAFVLAQELAAQAGEEIEADEWGSAAAHVQADKNETPL